MGSAGTTAGEIFRQKRKIVAKVGLSDDGIDLVYLLDPLVEDSRWLPPWLGLCAGAPEPPFCSCRSREGFLVLTRLLISWRRVCMIDSFCFMALYL